jgi:hypothetical protein
MVSLAPQTPRGPEASIAALRAAVEWYVRRAPRDHATFSPSLAAQLLDALAAPDRWEPLFFELLFELLCIVQAMATDHPDAPGCNIGDLVTVIGQITPAAKAPWPWDPAVEPAVLSSFEIRETSTGIARNHDRNREGWWPHTRRNRAFVLAAARSCSRRGSALLLGAGHAFDLPLRELLETFQRVRIVDIDGEALEATMRTIPSADLRRRIQPEVADLTGVNRRLVAGIQEIVSGAADATAARTHIAALCRSYSLDAGPRLLADDERADLVVSSCLLSQLAWPQARWARALYERRFGPLAAADMAAWQLPWREFEARVQQDHINALPSFGEVAVLTSDTAFRPVVIDGAGREHAAGEPIFLLSARTLRDRVPCFITTTTQATWNWNLLRPTRHQPGRRYAVEALVLRRSANAA